MASCCPCQDSTQTGAALSTAKRVFEELTLVIRSVSFRIGSDAAVGEVDSGDLPQGRDGGPCWGCKMAEAAVGVSGLAENDRVD